MTARDLPVGARFTLPGEDTLYTVTHQVPGKHDWEIELHLTYCRFWSPWIECEETCAFAGHTEVTLVPDTRATDSTPP